MKDGLGIGPGVRALRPLFRRLMFTGFGPQAQSAQPASHPPAPLVQPTRPATTPPTLPARVATPEESAAQRILETRVRELGRGFSGEVGIAVRDVDTGWTTSWNGNRFFPQQSVSKFWVALTALQARRRRPARPRPAR